MSRRVVRPVRRAHVSVRAVAEPSSVSNRRLLLGFVTATAMLAASANAVSAQEPVRSGTVVPVLLDRAVPDAVTPAPRVVRPQWEHGALMVSRGGNHFRWAGPENTLVESRNPVEFLLKLGADPYLRLREGRQLDEVQAAILGELGRQSWELVSCQYVRNDFGEHMTQCYLKRPMAATP